MRTIRYENWIAQYINIRNIHLIVDEFDNHEEHIKCHSDYIKYTTIKHSEDELKRLVDHIQEHIIFLKEVDGE